MTNASLPATGPSRADFQGSAHRDSRTTGMRQLWGSLLVATLAVLALWSVADHFEPDRLHLHGLGARLNDQAGYVTTARILADTGELRSGLVLPAFADHPASRVYMPGHYVMLALSYKLFGYSVGASLLPNLVAFVLAAVGVFLIGARRYGAPAGIAAALFTIAFPPNLVFAFTAMAEGTILAVGVAAFCVFNLIGPRARLVSAPFLVAASFLFRETGALWVIPMVLVVLHESRDRRWRRATMLALATVAVVFAVQRWQLASGKEAPPLTWLTGDGFNYGDAQAVAGSPDSIAPFEFLGLVWTNLTRNVESLVEHVLMGSARFERGSVFALIAIVVSTLVMAVARIRRDPLPLAAAGLALATWALAFGLYDVIGLKLVRSSMFFVPLCAIALAGGVSELLDRVRPRAAWTLPLLLLASLVTWFGWSAPASRGAGLEVVAGDDEADAALRIVSQLGHDESTLLVAPWPLGMQYAVARYPALYSFPVDNAATLRLLAEHHSIGTLIVRPNGMGDVTPRVLRGAGLAPMGQLAGAGESTQYVVFQRPR
ncbi:MAG: hypothetical protein ACI8QZ_002032 [Chlamydiales bacterium]|jgi:hypothetical protein